MRRLMPLLGALALVSALSGCSVATQNTATPLPTRLTVPPTTTTTTVPSSKGTHQIKVYFLKNGRLYPVLEYYSSDPLGLALGALEIGPTAIETDEGLTSAITEQAAQITSVGPPRDGIALIEVDQAFVDLPGEALEQAFAQIVFTVTGLPDGPASVEFFYNSNRMQALIPPGQLVIRAVTRSDYCAFAPLSYIPCQKVTGTAGIT
ncbi:MAG TPA: GerMN domain-containing protein [Acidimicrobiales bacterium]